MIALLLIQELWKRENQSRNQTELVNRAGQLHDKVTLFLESFTDVGFEISQAKEAFDKAESQLISGKGNVIRQAEQMRELGAKTSKELRGSKRVKKLAEQADFEEDNELLIAGLDDDAVSSNSAPHVTIVDKSPPSD
jgi:DNA recombination protein RmuC